MSLRKKSKLRNLVSIGFKNKTHDILDNFSIFPIKKTFKKKLVRKIDEYAMKNSYSMSWISHFVEKWLLRWILFNKLINYLKHASLLLIST